MGMRERSMRVALVAFAASLESCLGPTEIVVDISTNACDAVNQNGGVGVAVGPPGDETRAFAAVGTSCADGGVGTLTVTPSRGFDDPVAVRVVLGVNALTSSCAAPLYTGCIIARRSLLYDPHVSLDLPVELDSACVDHPCDPGTTCVGGACVSVTVSCDGGACALPPDAGTCVSFGPTTLKSGVPIQSPHVARMGSGWVVSYSTSPQQLHTVVIDSAGHSSNDVAATLLPSNGTSDAFGPIGSSGESYAITYADGVGDLYVDLRTPAGALLVPSSPLEIVGQGPPIGGVAFDADAGEYLLATTPSSGYATIQGVDPAQGVATTLTQLPVTQTTNASLVLPDLGTAYVGLTLISAQTCEVFQCTYIAHVAQCGQKAIYTVPSCANLRIAAEPGGNYFTAAFVISDASSAGFFMTAVNGTNGSIYSGSVDGPSAINALTSAPGVYRVVWRSAGDLYTALFPNGGSETQIVTNVGASTQGPGFEAVADGVGQTGYAVAFTQTDDTVRFQHFCQ